MWLAGQVTFPLTISHTIRIRPEKRQGVGKLCFDSHMVHRSINPDIPNVVIPVTVVVEFKRIKALIEAICGRDVHLFVGQAVLFLA